MRLSGCPAVARTLALHYDAYSIYTVQELLPGGSLQALLDAAPGGAISEAEAAAAARGVLTALAACHDAGYCYGGELRAATPFLVPACRQHTVF